MTTWTDTEAEALLEELRQPLHVRAHNDDEEERLQGILNGAWRAAQEVMTLRAQLQAAAVDARRAQPTPPGADWDPDTDPALRDWHARMDMVRLERMLGVDTDDVLGAVAGLLARQETQGPAGPAHEEAQLWGAYDPEEHLLLYSTEADALDDARARLDAWLDSAEGPEVPHAARQTYVVRVVWQCSGDPLAPELLRRQDV